MLIASPPRPGRHGRLNQGNRQGEDRPRPILARGELPAVGAGRLGRQRQTDAEAAFLAARTRTSRDDHEGLTGEFRRQAGSLVDHTVSQRPAAAVHFEGDRRVRKGILCRVVEQRRQGLPDQPRVQRHRHGNVTEVHTLEMAAGVKRPLRLQRLPGWQIRRLVGEIWLKIAAGEVLQLEVPVDQPVHALGGVAQATDPRSGVGVRQRAAKIHEAGEQHPKRAAQLMGDKGEEAGLLAAQAFFLEGQFALDIGGAALQRTLDAQMQAEQTGRGPRHTGGHHRKPCRPAEHRGAGQRHAQGMAGQGEARPGGTAPTRPQVCDGGHRCGQHEDQLQGRHRQLHIARGPDQPFHGGQHRCTRQPGQATVDSRKIRRQPQGAAQQQDDRSPDQTDADTLRAIGHPCPTEKTRARPDRVGDQRGQARQPEAGAPPGPRPAGQVDQPQRQHEAQQGAGQQGIKRERCG